VHQDHPTTTDRTSSLEATEVVSLREETTKEEVMKASSSKLEIEERMIREMKEAHREKTMDSKEEEQTNKVILRL